MKRHNTYKKISLTLSGAAALSAACVISSGPITTNAVIGRLPVNTTTTTTKGGGAANIRLNSSGSPFAGIPKPSPTKSSPKIVTTPLPKNEGVFTKTPSGASSGSTYDSIFFSTTKHPSLKTNTNQGNKNKPPQTTPLPKSASGSSDGSMFEGIKPTTPKPTPTPDPSLVKSRITFFDKNKNNQGSSNTQSNVRLLTSKFEDLARSNKQGITSQNTTKTQPKAPIPDPTPSTSTSIVSTPQTTTSSGAGEGNTYSSTLQTMLSGLSITSDGNGGVILTKINIANT